MDFFTIQQLWGVALFFLGAGILSLCSRWERQEDLWLRDPKNRYLKGKYDFVMPRTVRGIVMTFTGSLISLVGITLFFLYIPASG